MRHDHESRAAEHASHRNRIDDHSEVSTAEELRDPVCGMTVSKDSAHFTEHDGARYVFCSAGCRAKFVRNPAQYLSVSGSTHRTQHADEPTASLPLKAPSGAIYTCPMHPEIRQDHPGICPKCGMTLEPLMPELASDDNPELRDFQRRFWWTLPLTIAVMVLAMLGHRFGWMKPGDANVGRAGACRCRSCCGQAGRSFFAVLNRSSIAVPTCGR